eukprot:5090701-Amphidinium_carterae.1
MKRRLRDDVPNGGDRRGLVVEGYFSLVNASPSPNPSKGRTFFIEILTEFVTLLRRNSWTSWMVSTQSSSNIFGRCLCEAKSIARTMVWTSNIFLRA